MTLGHIMGLPVEETVLQAVAVGATTGTAIGVACCVMLDRLIARLKRR
jgi:fructose-1-phosphate kinase PfkB-like protein